MSTETHLSDLLCVIQALERRWRDKKAVLDDRYVDMGPLWQNREVLAEAKDSRNVCRFALIEFEYIKNRVKEIIADRHLNAHAKWRLHVPPLTALSRSDPDSYSSDSPMKSLI